MENIAIIGAGSWGTAVGLLLARNGHNVTMWCRREEVARDISENHENSQYLKTIKLPNNLLATTDLQEAVKNTQLVILAVPSTFFRQVLQQLKPHLSEGTILAHVVKGMEVDTGKLMSDIIDEEIPTCKHAVISGPNHAEEVANNLPAATVVASADLDVATTIAELFTSETFKAYPHPDVKGVEICGVMKNIIALAIGVCDGLRLGENAKGSILTLGLTEMAKVSLLFGAKKETSYGLAGVGDLVTTCFSQHSRNRFVGEQLSQGKTMKEISMEMNGMVAEGVSNTKAIYEYCKEKGVETPIITQAYDVLYKEKNLKEAMSSLLSTV